MRKKLCLLLAVLLLGLLLCGCGNYEKKLVATWEGDGTMDLAPLVGAQVLEFREDGVLAVQTAGGVEQYGFSATDDTLTVRRLDKDMAWGFAYDIRGNTLVLGRGTPFRKAG